MSINYCWWDGSGFQNVASSTIRIGNGSFRQVILCILPDAIYIFEDGSLLGVWYTKVLSPFQPTFHWQILAAEATLQAALSDIVLVPSSFTSNVNSPWDIALSGASNAVPDTWQITRQPYDPIPISLSQDGYMRASTASLAVPNSWVYTQAAFPLASNGIVMYRMRVNASGGSETKVTILGEYILRITNSGQSLEWDMYIYGEYFKLANSSIRVGSSEWTVIMIIYNDHYITFFENGVELFSMRTSTTENIATFHVQHLDINTDVSVDLSNVRCFPVSKPAESIIRDLQPDLLTYYPLKSNISEAIFAIRPLDLIPVQDYSPTYVPGVFGNAISFAKGTGALRIPLYPYGRSFPFYTLALWVRVEQYPTEQDKAGIVGSLAIRADGRLEFIFRYTDSMTYGQPETTFTSTASLPLSAWVSVVVTYAYEQSRLSIYIGGDLDSTVYMAPDNSSQHAITPMAGYIGAAALPSTGDLVILQGQIGDVMFFKQYSHNMVARALANLPEDGDISRRVSPLIPLILPLFIILAFEVVCIGVVLDVMDKKMPQPPPSLDTVVSRIIEKVGFPARPGAQASRRDLQIDESYPIVLDVGGEGPLESNGFVTGFPDVININDKDMATNSPYGPIPLLVKVRDWAGNPGYPFVENFADRMVMIGCPMTEKNISEFARVIKPRGTIDLWVIDYVPGGVERLAKMLKSTVTFPEETDRFKGNGQPPDWMQRRQIRANK
jgi:hypothetical protein